MSRARALTQERLRRQRAQDAQLRRVRTQKQHLPEQALGPNEERDRSLQHRRSAERWEAR